METIVSEDKHKYFIVHKSAYEHIVLIPSDVKHAMCVLMNTAHGLAGHVKVIGGSGLTTAKRMFEDCKVSTLDLRNFETRNVTDLQNIFKNYSCDVKTSDKKLLELIGN